MSTNGRSSTKDREKEAARRRVESGIFGYDELLKLFVGMADNKTLFQSYIFFGEIGVGKFTFADYLANYLEFGSFSKPTIPRSETMILTVSGGKESIGIDAIRDAKYFLSKQPSASAYRTVIVDGADNLTDQAQNALLKISEEPPAHGLLILITANLDNLLPTLQSRFHKIYFPRLPEERIKKYLGSVLKLGEEEAIRIAANSFGRIGRALQLRSDDERAIRADVLKAIKNISAARQLVTDNLDDPDRLNAIIKEMIAELARNPERNTATLRELVERAAINNLLNANKRLQLEAALWTI